MTNSLLTEREYEILKHLVDGRQNKYIARELGISPFTVRDHMARIFKKTGVSNRFELGLLASRGTYDFSCPVAKDPSKSPNLPDVHMQAELRA